MIKSISGKMWCNGEKKNLRNLSVEMSEDEWNGFIYEVYAVGEAPRVLTMPDFEQLVLESDTGMQLSWHEVK